MARTKKKVELKNLGKQYVKEALLRVHPFLRVPYRTIKKEELESKEVLFELFPETKNLSGVNLDLSFYKLYAIYALQN